MTGNGRINAKENYNKLSKEERQSIGKTYFTEWNLQSYTKIQIKEQYTDLNLKYSS